MFTLSSDYSLFLYLFSLYFGLKTRQKVENQRWVLHHMAQARKGDAVYRWPLPRESYTYALPIHVVADVLYYNVNRLAEAGIAPPENWTWIDLQQNGRKLARRDAEGTTIQTALSVNPAGGWSGGWWYEWVWGAGGDILDASGQRFILDSVQASEGLQFIQDLLVENIASAGGPMDFMNQKSAMTIHWFGPEFEELNNTGITWDIELVPQGPAGRYAWSGASGFAIAADTSQPAAAWELLKETVRTVSSEWGFREVGAGPGVLRESYEDLSRIPWLPPNFSKWVEAFDESRTLPPNYLLHRSAVDNLLVPQLEAIYTGKIDPRVAMQEVVPALNQLLQELH